MVEPVRMEVNNTSGLSPMSPVAATHPITENQWRSGEPRAVHLGRFRGDRRRGREARFRRSTALIRGSLGPSQPMHSPVKSFMIHCTRASGLEQAGGVRCRRNHFAMLPWNNLHPFLLVRHVGPVSAASRVIDALLHLVAHE
jgi:hypothetical protein